MKKQTATPVTTGRKRVTFLWPAGKASAAVAGDFSNWEHLPLKPQGKSMARVMYLPPGDYQYRFVVDGEWCSDPASPELTPNAFGSFNNVLHVS